MSAKRNLIHDMKAELDQIGTCFQCIIFDVKDQKSPDPDDVQDLKSSIKKFEEALNKLIEGNL